MNTNLTIKNFRVFDNNGVKIEIAPLTFLVGCNSSGKSSIVKAISLIKTFFRQEYNSKNPVSGSSIDFSESPNNSLGSFKNVLRRSSRVKEVSLAYETHSVYLDDDVIVTITLEEGDLGNAKIKYIQITTVGGKAILDTISWNISYLKDTFKRYLIAIRFRSDVKDILLHNSNKWSADYFQLEKELLNGTAAFFMKDYNKAIRYCSPDYLKEVYNSINIHTVKENASIKCAIDKFIETGILTYSSLFDEMKRMKDSEDIRVFLKSKNKDNEDWISKAIDIICTRYKDSCKNDFLSFYRSMEDNKLEIYNATLRDNHYEDFSDSFLYGNYKYRLPNNMDNEDEAYYSKYLGIHFIRNVFAHLSAHDNYYQIIEKDDYLTYCEHPLFHNVFRDYVNDFINEVINYDITEGFEYISSSRIQVRRMYPMEDRTEFSKAVRRYYETRNKFMTLYPPIKVTLYDEENGIELGETLIANFVPGNFMDKWLKTFNIGHHISMEMDDNELGLLLKIHKDASDKKGMLLADMGYGITQFFSIVLQIEEMIMSSLYNKYKQYALTETDKKLRRRFLSAVSLSKAQSPCKPQTIAIEEPEIHLHPKYQSLLAEMFYEAYRDYNIQFIIETHSEYLLRKIQTLIGAKKLSPEEVSMIYVEDDANVQKGAKKVRRIPIKEDGRLAEPFGPGFYDEADNLSLELFTNMGK